MAASTVTTGDWTMNKSSLEKGMLIRRPGLKEALEVVDVKSGQAKVKLADGKTTTISAKAEVLYRWPEKAKKEAEERGDIKQEKAESKPKSNGKPASTSRRSKPDPESSTLKPGDRILMTGEIYLVIRVSDTQVRLKNEDDGGLTSIPPDFDDYEMVLDKPKVEEKERGKEGAGRSKPASRREEQMEIGEAESESDEIPDDIKEEIDQAFRAEDENQDLEGETGEVEEESEIDADKENDMATAKDNEWLTVQQLSEESGLSVVKINQLRKDKEIPNKLYKSDPDDQRRIIYHVDLIEKLGNLTPARRGRKPGRPQKEEKESRHSESRESKGAPGGAPTVNRPTRQVAPPDSAISGSLNAYLSKAIEAAEDQIGYLQQLVETLKAQQEALQVWS